MAAMFASISMRKLLKNIRRSDMSNETEGWAPKKVELGHQNSQVDIFGDFWVTNTMIATRRTIGYRS